MAGISEGMEKSVNLRAIMGWGWESRVWLQECLPPTERAGGLWEPSRSWHTGWRAVD